MSGGYLRPPPDFVNRTYTPNFRKTSALPQSTTTTTAAAATLTTTTTTTTNSSISSISAAPPPTLSVGVVSNDYSKNEDLSTNQHHTAADSGQYAISDSLDKIVYPEIDYRCQHHYPQQQHHQYRFLSGGIAVDEAEVGKCENYLKRNFARILSTCQVGKPLEFAAIVADSGEQSVLFNA